MSFVNMDFGCDCCASKQFSANTDDGETMFENMSYDETMFAPKPLGQRKDAGDRSATLKHSSEGSASSSTFARKLQRQNRVCPVLGAALLEKRMFKCSAPEPLATSEMAKKRSNFRASGGSDSLTELLNKPLLPRNGSRNLREELCSQSLSSYLDFQRKPFGYVRSHAQLNYDDEAKRLWAQLNLGPAKEKSGRFSPLDPIWCHPETKARIYVGNGAAAKDLQLLQGHDITHVVNCTDSIPNHHEKESGAPITYFRFDITCHHLARTEKETLSFVQPMLDFISNALDAGKNVMVHCLAGAHRAGTTGIICLMYFAKLSVKDAKLLAKQCRPIIDPIGDFPSLLARLEQSWRKLPCSHMIEDTKANLE